MCGAKLLLFTLFLLGSGGLTADAQGCAACRDATAGSAPHARQALRHGVLLLGLPAGALFLGIFALARRMDKH